MTHAELRRLAIRLARELNALPGLWFVKCHGCGGCVSYRFLKDATAAPLTHDGADCPIAELEAEEAKGEPVITLLASEWVEVQLDESFGAKRMAWVRMGSFEVEKKPATKFEGEY